MSNKYLICVSLAMIAVATAGLALFYTVRGGLPPAVSYDWPERDAGGNELDATAQTSAVTEYRTHATATARFLAGTEASRRFDAVRTGAVGASDFDAGFDAKFHTRSFFESARLHATVAIIMCYVLLACGLLGLARLNVRGLVAIGGGVLVLGLLGGGALLYFTGAGTLAAIMTGLMLLALFGQLVAANLMIGANHPFVLAAEDELRRLPPDRRRRHIMVRMAAGIGLTLFGVVMTALSMAIHAGVVVVATGAIAGGLMMMVTPLIAAIRLRATQ